MIGTCLGAFAGRVFAAMVGGRAFLMVLVFVFTAGTQAIAQTMTAPDITSESPFLVDEGETAVATLTADDSDTATTDLIWTNTGGADSAKFSLTSAGVLTFSAAKDYEAPDDPDGDGTYEVTVQVSDGTATDSADLVVTLENVVELTALSGPSTVDYEENRAVRVAAYSVSSEADRELLSWSLSGTDAGSFSIDDPVGVLRFDLAVVSPNLFSPPPDYDAPADADSDGTYEVTVEVEHDGTSHSLAVEVTITDQDEAGTLTLSTTRPQFGVALTTTLTDPDGVTGTATYRWERSVGRSAWTDIVGATASSYTLTSAETGHFLRVTATYTDGHGGGNTAAARTAEVVTADLLSGLTVSTTDSAANSGHALRPSFDAGILHYSIGRQFAEKLDRKGTRTALDLTRLSDGWVRKEMSVQGLRTVLELRGEDCIGFEDMPHPKQSTMVSRSFGTPVTALADLVDAITVFATDAARSIRTANRVCSSVHVFIETSRFRKDPPYAPARLEALSPPTHNTRHIVGAALKGLKEIYREGLAYKRAGVMLLDLVDARQAQASLFDRPDPKDDRLIEAMDAIEGRMGPGSIRFGHSGSAARWRPSGAFRSPGYTTRWADIPVVKT